MRIDVADISSPALTKGHVPGPVRGLLMSDLSCFVGYRDDCDVSYQHKERQQKT